MTKQSIPSRKQKNKPVQAIGHLRKSDPLITKVTNHCFGCAPANRYGLKLKFTENATDLGVESVFRVARRFEGPSGHVHGGIIATILDEAMGKVNRRKGIIALTGRIAIDYLQPVPRGVKLRAVGWPVKQEGRKHFMAGEIRTLDGEVLARSEGLFIAIDPVAMLRKYGARIAANRKNA